MTTSPNTTGGGRRRWDAGVRAGVISAVAGVLALVVALLTWLVPREPADQDPAGAEDGGPATTRTGPGSVPPSAAGTAAGESSVAATTFLATGAFRPESGGVNLVEVPRAIRGKAGYTGHEIAVRCPSNETGDHTSDITYVLLGRYAQLDVTVHPYYPAGTDQQAATYVTALAGTRRTDGGLDTKIVGDQKTATPKTAAALSAPVDGAEKLTLRVECGNPNGTVILTDARLTPA